MSEEVNIFSGECFFCRAKTENNDRDIEKFVCEECEPKLGLVKQKTMEKTLTLLGGQK